MEKIRFDAFVFSLEVETDVKKLNEINSATKVYV